MSHCYSLKSSICLFVTVLIIDIASSFLCLSDPYLLFRCIFCHYTVQNSISAAGIKYMSRMAAYIRSDCEQNLYLFNVLNTKPITKFKKILCVAGKNVHFSDVPYKNPTRYSPLLIKMKKNFGKISQMLAPNR